MPALTLTPAVSTTLLAFPTQGVLYPSATTYPGAGVYPSSSGLTLAAASSSTLTLTPA